MLLHHYTHLHLTLPKKHSRTRFFLFFLPQLFLFFADAVLVLTFPILLAQKLDSATLVGAILAISGVASIVFDVCFPGFFRDTSWRAQLVYSISIALLFVLSLHALMLFTPLFFAVLSGVIRGAYRELMYFVRDETIAAEEPKQEHVRDYSILSIGTGTILIIGAMLGTHLVTEPIQVHTNTLFAILGLALFSALCIARLFRSKKREHETAHIETPLRRKGIMATLREWRVLMLPTVAALGMTTIASWIVVVHLSFGGLFTLSLPFGNEYTWAITFIYNAAFLIVALTLLLGGAGTIQNGKKKISQYAIIAAGTFLLPIPLFAHYTSIVLLCIFISCIFFAIAAIFTQAVLANVAGRVGAYKLSFISLQNIWGSSALIVAPLITGYLIDTLGFFAMYSITGAMVITTTFLLYLITPKKIHIPQHELATLHLK